MARLIDADALVKTLLERSFFPVIVRRAIEKAPTIDAVPAGAYRQCAWERDTAIAQLRDIGLSFGEKTDDVVKVVRCKDCKHRGKAACPMFTWDSEDWDIVFDETIDEGFCYMGERDTDGEIN